MQVTTADFVPDAHLRDLLCERAASDVEIRLLVPGPHVDKDFVRLAGQDTYAELLDAGIELWEYQPTMLHAKVVTIDGCAALVGSANLNNRSLDHDDELGVIIYDDALTEEIDRHFEEDLERSELVHVDRWGSRTLMHRALEQATRPLRRWF